MKRLRRSYSDMASLRAELQEEAVLVYPVKRFGKYDRVSRMTCCVAGLAFYDAGMSYCESEKQDIGIIGSNRAGCLESNVEFFRDFVEHGRSGGRANLFVYTLPSIPMAEAALYFKCGGPVLYMACIEGQVSLLLRRADRMVEGREAGAMMAVWASEESAVCFMVRRGEDALGGARLGVEEVVRVTEEDDPVGEIVAALTEVERQKGH